MTEAEAVLWTAIRRGQLGCRFRRQHPLGPFLVDFVCLRHRYVVEVDGGQHIDSAYDDARTRWLNDRDFTVVRFRNNLVLGELDMVTDTIAGHAFVPLERSDRGKGPASSAGG
jgi:very-short-patch-repair endonuclease